MNSASGSVSRPGFEDIQQEVKRLVMRDLLVHLLQQREDRQKTLRRWNNRDRERQNSG
jgi:hypothetical protein